MIIRYNFLLILHKKNICCDPSSEPSHQDGSAEGSQPMILKKNYPPIINEYSLLSNALAYDENIKIHCHCVCRIGQSHLRHQISTRDEAYQVPD